MLNESPCTLISFEIKYENMNEVLPGTSQTNTGYMKKKCLELLSLTFRSIIINCWLYILSRTSRLVTVVSVLLKVSWKVESNRSKCWSVWIYGVSGAINDHFYLNLSFVLIKLSKNHFIHNFIYNFWKFYL